jgi:hypothetical protein
VSGQQEFDVSKWIWNSPKRFGGAGSPSHGGQGNEAEGVMHDGGADW